MLLSEWTSSSGIDTCIHLLAWTKTSVSHPWAYLSFSPITPMHHQLFPLQLSKHISNPVNVPVSTLSPISSLSFTGTSPVKVYLLSVHPFFPCPIHSQTVARMISIKCKSNFFPCHAPIPLTASWLFFRRKCQKVNISLEVSAWRATTCLCNFLSSLPLPLAHSPSSHQPTLFPSNRSVSLLHQPFGTHCSLYLKHTPQAPTSFIG